jgi:hypothetical protein
MPSIVAVFAYNRFEHFKRTIAALRKNTLARQSDIVIFSDGPRQKHDEGPVENIRQFARNMDGFNSIRLIARESNLGLARSIITGVHSIFTENETVIVLEDDLLTSPDFLTFMNDCLDVFRDDEKIFSVSGYSPDIGIPVDYAEDIYLSYRPNAWGWATWKDRWNAIDWTVNDFDTFIRDRQSIAAFNRAGQDATTMLLKQMTGKINSWAIRFHYACHRRNGFCVYPVRSKIRNTGTDGSGTNLRGTRKYDLSYELKETPYVLSPAIEPDDNILKNFARFFRPSILRKMINYFKLRRYRISGKL